MTSARGRNSVSWTKMTSILSFRSEIVFDRSASWQQVKPPGSKNRRGFLSQTFAKPAPAMI